ncbi:MAG: transposase [Thermoplasmatota archaeon]
MIKKVHRIFVSEKNTKSTSRGHPAWIISFRAYKNDTDTWLGVYHLRSIIESVFSSIKRRWGGFLNSRKQWMQKRELALKVLSYNVKQVLMINYAKEQKIPLWTTC